MKTKTFMAIALLACSSVLQAQTPSCIPPQGLVAYWPLDNVNNADALGYPSITIVGALPNATDRFSNPNSAYSFDGLNDYIETGYAGILGSAARAVSFWARVPLIRINVVSGAGMYPVAWGDNGTGQRFGCSLDVPADATAIGGANCYQAFSSAGQIDDGAWHHYVFQYSGSGDFTTVEVYIDGVCTKRSLSQSSGANNTLNTVNGGSYNVHFGKTNYSTPNWFEGDLDEVAIWDRMLTPCEIHRLYDCTGCDSCCEARRPAKNEGFGTIHEIANSGTAIAEKRAMSGDENVVLLDQNVPNPFSESTTISYKLPAAFSKAEMVFTNTDGLVVKTMNLANGKKEGVLTVMANDLSRGIYSYALVVDGKILESKKLIKE